MKYQPPFDPNFAGPVDGIYNADPDAPYQNGNPATGEEGSVPPMESVAHPMKELVHLIQYSGQTPSHEDLEQVRKAIKLMIEQGTVSNPVTGGAVAIWEGLQPVTFFHKIRALKAGANVSLDLVEEPSGSGQFQIVISATSPGGGGGGSNPLTNVGGGAQVYKGFNSPNEELRTLKGINGIGVTQNASDITIDGAGFGQFMPFFPEIETADNKLIVTQSTGQVIVAADQSFIHRGCRRILTSSTNLAGRTKATAASKIYHLRWRWTNGVPVYALLDLANAGYNPGGLAEDHASFDSTYDDMLIARVITSSGNVPTVKSLINRHQLRAVKTEYEQCSTSRWDNGAQSIFSYALDWARKPDVLPSWYRQDIQTASGLTQFAPDVYHDHDNALTVTSASRYAVGVTAVRDYCEGLGAHVLCLA